MYKITVIETPQELFHALSNHRVKGDDFPIIKEGDIVMTMDVDGLTLECKDKHFDISRVNKLGVLKQALAIKGIEFQAYKNQPDSKGVGP